ncbi:MAG: N-acetylmuramoyl-L-alanine amidase [Firmicutes bacterium]|nr:N-acetylmuramoyl-L-alanine amidase [Bacillota bacterium]
MSTDRLVTNIQAGPPKSATAHAGPADLSTRILVESTVALEPGISSRKSGRGSVLVLEFGGVRLNMPDCSIPVYDGLIDHLVAWTAPAGSVLEAYLEHDVPYSVDSVAGVPHRLEIRFDMKPIYRVLAGRTLVVDAGHGGMDPGRCGPVDLVEKHVVLDLARRLKSAIERAGMRCIMTRNGDVFLSWEARLELVNRHGAAAFVSLHTGGASESAVRGAGVAYAGPRGEGLARLVLGELTKRLHLPSRGIRPSSLASAPPVPAAVVEFVTITNPVDEGLVRSYVFMDRVAQAVLNGIKNFYWEAEPAG